MAFYGFQTHCTIARRIPGKLNADGTPTTLESRRLLFDNEIINGETIISSSDNGLITIKYSGNYYVSWSITLSTGLGQEGASFALIENHYINGSDTSFSTEEYGSGNGMKTGQFCGDAIIQIPEGQICKLAIYNTSDHEAYLANNVPVKGNITIHPYVTGTYSSSFGLVGITLKLNNDPSIDSSLAYNAPIMFNVPDIPAGSQKIFNYKDGIITTLIGGNFTLDWAVNLDGSQDAQAISFSLMSNNKAVAVFDSTLMMQNSYSGFAYITATGGQEFQLVNTSATATGAGASLQFSNIPTRAILRMVGHS